MKTRTREPFEEWARNAGHEYMFDRFDTDHYERPGEYEDYGIQVAWEAWQAAIEHAKKTMSNRN